MKPKNVLYCVYPWAFDCPGGGERQLMAYRRHLADVGVEVELYDIWSPQLDQCDVFHFFSAMPGSIQLCNHVRQRGLPVVISPNLWVTEETKFQYPHQDIRELLAIADAVVVNSNAEVASLSSVYELSVDKLHVVHNGVEKGFLAPPTEDLFRKQFQLGDSPFVLNIANIEPRKNQLAFLEALKSFPELRLVNIGQVRDDQYARECAETGGDQFLALGTRPYGSNILASAAAECCFFAMPSTLETPSIAALEAGAAGARILITEVGSTREYFLDHAVYVRPNSIESMRDGIHKILNSSPTNQLQERIRRKFLWTDLMKQLIKVYHSVS